MKARRYIAVCLLAGGLAFGAGSAASLLLSRTASTTGGSDTVGAETLPELVTVALDESVDSSGGARTIHVAKYEITVGAWDRCAADGGCSFTPRRRPYQNADHPVTGVNCRILQTLIRALRIQSA